jgi:hypothetical protein
MLANRGLLLEVLPILRLAVEMMAWSLAAFNLASEEQVKRLNAQRCLSKLKAAYPKAGEIYGYLSEFSHWRFVVHSSFLKIEGERVGVLSVSCQYRAMSLALSVVVLDLFIEVVRLLYGSQADTLVHNAQGTLSRDNSKSTHQALDKLTAFAQSKNFDELKMLLC